MQDSLFLHTPKITPSCLPIRLSELFHSVPSVPGRGRETMACFAIIILHFLVDLHFHGRDLDLLDLLTSLPPYLLTSLPPYLLTSYLLHPQLIPRSRVLYSFTLHHAAAQILSRPSLNHPELLHISHRAVDTRPSGSRDQWMHPERDTQWQSECHRDCSGHKCIACRVQSRSKCFALTSSILSPSSPPSCLENENIGSSVLTTIVVCLP
jgi:hypothetical protein